MQIPARNLLHWIKKECISTTTMNNFLLANPAIERRVGSLPFEWIKQIPKSERGNITEQIHRAFESFSTKTSEIRGLDYYECFAGCAEDFVPEQNKLLELLKKLLRRNDINIEYAGSGQLKNCSRIKVGDKTYALSTFRINCTKFNGYFEKAQGRGHETQTQFTTYKRGSHGRIAKPFMGKVCSEEDNGGYILSKYIEESHPVKKYKSEILRTREFTQNADNAVGPMGEINNTINGISIEAGGIFGNSRYIKDPQVRQIWYNLANKLNSEAQLLSNGIEINGKFVDMQKISDYLYNLKKHGIDLCTADSRSILQELTQEEQKAATKLIRILKRTRTLKNKLIENGTFCKYQTLLNDDLKVVFPLKKHSREYSNIIEESNYPQLIADELGVNNIPNLEQMIKWVNLRVIKPEAIKKYYTESQIKNFINENYQLFTSSKSNLVSYLSKEFNIDKELKIVEIKNKIVNLEEQLRDTDADIIFLSKNNPQQEINKLKEILTSLLK